MNLREQLRNLLPALLPDDPAEAVKGTELIRLVRLRLGDGCSDATLRYHFSILSYDPSSPIAKVDQGQGYYRRQKKTSSAGGSVRQSFFEEAMGEDDQACARHLRLVAIYERLCLLRGRYPYLLNRTISGAPSMESEWDVPDLITAEWDLDTSAEDGSPRFDEDMLSLRRHLGGSEVTLSGVQLKMGLTLENYSACCFQALSSTRWTQQSELILAEPLADEALADALRGLGHQFGLGISTLGIQPAQLDALPSSKEIRTMPADAFEHVHNRLRIQRITTASPRQAVDWNALSALRRKHDSVSSMVSWLSDCLTKRQPDWPAVW